MAPPGDPAFGPTRPDGDHGGPTPGDAPPRGGQPSRAEQPQPDDPPARPAPQYPAPQYPAPQYPPSQYPPGSGPAPQYPPSQYPPSQYPPGSGPAPQYPPSQYPPGSGPAPQYPPPGYPPPQYTPPPPYPGHDPPPQYPGDGSMGWQTPSWPAPGGPPQWPTPGDRGGPPPHAPGTFLDRSDVPPANRSAAGFWLLMGAVGFAIGQVVGTIFVFVAAAAAGQSGELHRFATMAEPPEWYVGTSLVGLWVGFFAGPWIASKARGTGRFLADLGVRFKPADLFGILIGVGGQFLLDALYAPFVRHLKNFTAPTHRLVGASHGWGFVVIAVLTVLGAPFFEEILFRGLAFKALARLFTPRSGGPSRARTAGLVAAVVVDGLLFGLAHWELYQFAGLAVFGMALAVVSYRTGRLGMNMVAHASFNLVAVLALVGASGGMIH